MPIQYEDLENLRRITITGRLDIIGTEEIAVKFAGLACADNRRVFVDLTGVSFLASIGIRSFISNAKALQQRGGKMVLFVGGNEPIMKTLQTTGVDMLIPMFENETEAAEAALA